MNEGICLGIVLVPTPAWTEHRLRSRASPLCTFSLIPRQERKSEASNRTIQDPSSGGVDSAPQTPPSGEKDLPERRGLLFPRDALGG